MITRPVVLLTCSLFAFSLDADELNAPFFHPFDLHGREVRFMRTSESTYSSENTAATIDADFGASLAIPAAHHVAYTLPFPLPFFDRSVTELHVTDYNALFLAAPELPRAQQLGDLEAFASRQGVIAPMLTTDVLEYPQVFVKTLPDAVRFTWRRDGGWQYTVQATLHRNGTIVFAYDAPKAPYACAMLLTSGVEPVRGVVETIVVTNRVNRSAARSASAPFAEATRRAGRAQPSRAGSPAPRRRA